MKPITLWNSKCEKDYKNEHFWERMGVIFVNGESYIVWKCSQCQKCVYEELEFLKTKNKKLSEEKK